MKFKPVTENYTFKSDELTREFPPHLVIPISTWIHDVLRNASIWTYEDYQAISSEFLNNLDLLFREKVPFPRDHRLFLKFVLNDSERTINVIQICLQNYARPSEARKMEHILSVGGSAYAVMLESSKIQEYQSGIADIVERVPKIITETSRDVLDNNTLIQEAWHSCYSRNPDYEKTVSKCVDALEGLFKNKYFSQDPKPSLGKFLNNFIADPSKLSFLGDTLINPKNTLTDLAREFISIRGHHTSGTGRAPTKEEAVFVLHYTIFIFQVSK
ncbi:MAG: hypothetical protein QG570_743 [Patescibacteria group bacterium]|nr:hypothetical protein [Patescibacteria group bacterium]